MAVKAFDDIEPSGGTAVAELEQPKLKPKSFDEIAPSSDEDYAINKAAEEEEIRNRANPALDYYYNPEKAGKRAGEVFDTATQENISLPDANNVHNFNDLSYPAKVAMMENMLSKMTTAQKMAFKGIAPISNNFIAARLNQLGIPTFWDMPFLGVAGLKGFVEAKKAYLEAIQRQSAQAEKEEGAYSLLRPDEAAHFAGQILNMGAEFAAIPAGGVATKMALQTALTPTDLSWKEKTLSVAHSAALGAAFQYLGKIPVLRDSLPLRTVAGVGLASGVTAAQGGSPREIVESGAVILGFELSGIMSEALRTGVPKEQVIEQVKEIRPDLPVEKIQEVVENMNVVPVEPKPETPVKTAEKPSGLPVEAKTPENAGVAAEPAIDKTTQANKIPSMAEDMAARNNIAPQNTAEAGKGIHIPQNALKQRMPDNYKVELATGDIVKDSPENIKKGYVKASDAFEAIKNELTSQAKKIEQSDRSEALYFYMDNGRSIRLAKHAPVYYFPDNGITITVDNVYGKDAGDIIIRSDSAVNPKNIVQKALAANAKLESPITIKQGKNLKDQYEDFNYTNWKNGLENYSKVRTEELNKKTFSELVTIAKDIKASVYGRKKTDYIEAITNAEWNKIDDAKNKPSFQEWVNKKSSFSPSAPKEGGSISAEQATQETGKQVTPDLKPTGKGGEIKLRPVSQMGNAPEYVKPDTMQQAATDWAARELYIDNAGNWRLNKKGQPKRIAPYNSELKRNNVKWEDLQKYNEATKKQPWELTRDEYLPQVRGIIDKPLSEMKLHKEYVREAIAEGKPVPAKVLAEYPDLAGQGKIKEGDTQTSIGAAKDIKLDEALNRAIEKQATTFTKQVKGKWINSTEVPEYGDYYLTENGKAKFVEGKKLFDDESEAIKAGQYIADNTKKPQYVADTKEGFELTDTPPDIEHAEILPAGEGLTKDERALLTPQQIAEAEIAQQEGGRVGFKKGRAEALKEARQKLERIKMADALTDKLRIEASDMVYDFVPREKRGDFIKRILNAKTNEKVKSLSEDIEKYLSIAEKRLALSAIKKAVKRVGESNSIAVDYVEAINSLLSDIDLTKVSEATKDRVASAKEYIERQRAKGEDVSLPNKLLNSIERLNKKNIENITTEELKQLHNDIVRLEKIGRTKLKLTKERYERKKQEDLIRLKAESKPMTEKELAKPEKIGEKLPIGERLKNTLRNVFNTSARKHLAITPMDVFFDRLDGAKNYKGANYEIFKKPLDKGFSRFLDTRDSIALPIVELAQKLGLKEGNFDRIGVHAVREQEGGEQKLLDTGYTKEQIDAVELSPQEMEFYNAMRKSLDELRPSIEEVMRVTYNEPLGTVKNYFSFMTDFDAMSDYEMRDRFASLTPDIRNAYRKNTEKGFTKERTGGKQKIKINAMEVFTKHVDNAAYLVEMGAEIKRLGEIAASPQYREAVGDLGQEEVRGWIDLLARKGKQAGDRIGLLDTLRKHTGAAVLGFKLSSTLIQPTALLDGAAMIGEYAFVGAKDIATSREWREFSLKNFPELRDRVGDDPAYLDFGGTGIVTKVERAGFWALQKLDSITASAVTAGAYKKYMVEHKLPIDFDNPNADAIDYAQMILRKTQSSSFFKDLPPAFTRGELTGNKSLDRLVLQFQSFMLTRWSLIEHDMLRAGIKSGNRGQALNIFFFLSLATLAEVGIRRLSKETVAEVTGSETKDWSETFTKEVVVNALQNIPFVSQAVNFANYGNVPVPAIGLMQNIGSRIMELSRTKDLDKRRAKELELLILLGGTLVGMPGTLQASDIVRKLLTEPKHTNSHGKNPN